MKLIKPTLLLDQGKCRKNIRQMMLKADRGNALFRPHFKTHQSAVVGEWFREAGVRAIAVSSVTMAGYFARHGWNDITIAFPVNIAEIDEINELARDIKLNLLVENIEAVEFLISNLKWKTGIFIKINTGYNRTGIHVSEHQNILHLARKIQGPSMMQFKGLLDHNGHTYQAVSRNEIKTIHQNSLEGVLQLRAFLAENKIEGEISMGDTPAMSIVENFDGIDEVRPGNFVFYDVMQALLGSCGYDKIAVALACPVVAKHAERMEIVVYGGAVHLSKDFILGEDGKPVYGKIVRLNKNGWSVPLENVFVKSLSQEHGIIKADAAFFEQVRVGDFIGILPIHSCLTVNLMREFYTLDGERIATLNSVGP
jgi:D-serine deaminase-like pyridoxal phosphate-dependent protein